MRKHRSASGITAFNSMIYAAGGKNIVKLFFFKIQNDSTDSEPEGKVRDRNGMGSESEESWF
jgi:hypothetical protein